MGLPPDVRIGVPAKLVDCVHDLILQAFGAAIADNVQDSLPNSSVVVTHHLEDPLPELIDVSLHLAWAELLHGLESDIRIFIMGVLEDHIHIVGLTAEAHDVLLAGASRIQLLLLIVHALLTHFRLYSGASRCVYIQKSELFD